MCREGKRDKAAALHSTITEFDIIKLYIKKKTLKMLEGEMMH